MSQIIEAIEVTVPDIGNFHDVPIIELCVGEGDAVAAEQALLTLESDKATIDIPSPAAGVVRQFKVKVGDKVSQGTLVAVIETAQAVQGVAHDQHAPPLPYPFKATGDGAFGTDEGFALHKYSCVRVQT